jgi:hippurate hydrolase
MLRERPGAYIFLGNGDSRPLHHAAYDFNDDALRYGIALWVALVQSRLRRA